MPETASSPRYGRHLSGVYVLVWILLGGAAAAYLGALSIKPDLAGGLIAGRGLSAPQDNSAEPRTASAAGPSDAAAQAELARLRTAINQRDVQLKSLQLRVGAMQQDLEQARANRTAAAASEPKSDSPAGETARTTITAETPQGSKPVEVQIVNATPVPLDATATPQQALVADVPLPGRRPVPPALRETVTAIATSPIETGSLSAPAAAGAVRDAAQRAKAAAPAPAAPIAFGPATVTREAAPAGSAVGVRLSSGPSVDALRLSWSLMSERHGAELGSLEPRYVSGGNANAPYALIAGPLGDKAQAKNLCTALQQKGIPCVVDDFKGNAL